MNEKEIYIAELKKYAEKVENEYFDHIFGSDYANLEKKQHTMLLERLLSQFDFTSIEDKDFEKVELYDYWKGENDPAS